ncbi:site-specific DNA-methyltransferase [Sporolituus thermophilus]|uniref:Adenine-specific DNA-methyltransferase n=1 Tax=Sporolituus thermophilus DSM 23256 TaxID=1123285 RepID=A0A1G7JSA4_9FIRM|nr:site-specific DNA-methyltransferase [Sporolituus thermophilus]SDF27746.1 adenine-specific DNA-methyltransferase [Sporolituus thermophilus DSM 23256]
MEKLTMRTKDFSQENIAKLAKLFPNVVTEISIGKDRDGKDILKRAIDFDLLKQELSDVLVEGDKERYQLTWPGKKQAILHANAPTNKTLRPVKEDSVDWETTQNLYIEGDNLEVLKLLQEAYLNKVKLIYIDPPYNTGKDFIYKDDFKQSSEQYLRESGQMDEQGNRLVQNTEANGRFHSDWLSMMYPRLKLARNLLRDDGVIFISIDDNEVANLKKICDEIFGSEAFVAIFPWRKRTAKTDVPFGVSQDFEWIICYAKPNFLAGVPTERKYYTSPDFKERWRLSDLTTQRSAEERPNSFFTLVNPRTLEEYPANPNRVWGVTKETFQEYYAKGKIVFPGDYEFLNISTPYWRVFESEDKEKNLKKFGTVEHRKAISTMLPTTIGRTEDGTEEINELFGAKVFSFPKPTSLIEFFISVISSDDCIIVDFFAGSSSCAEAVLRLNAKDGGKRRFMCVQYPELLDPNNKDQKTGYDFCIANGLNPNICEIGKERIRRAAKKIKEETGADIDYGFRVFRLDSSNMKDVYYAPQDLTQEMVLALESNIKEDRTGEDLLIQVMLEWGLELSLPMEKRVIAGKDVHFVAGNSLIACFDDKVSDEVVRAIAQEKPLRVVFRDSSFASDADRINVEEIFKMLSPDTEIKVI